MRFPRTRDSSAWATGTLRMLLRARRRLHFRDLAQPRRHPLLRIEHGFEHTRCRCRSGRCCRRAPCRPASRVGFGFFSSSATADITNPGVQNPHIVPSCSQNACCTGCSTSPGSGLRWCGSLSLRLDRQHRAGVDGAPVDDHRAGAAAAAVADALEARVVKPIAQRIEQRHPRLDSWVCAGR